jgi:uncharacterized protein (TIGR04255 family)
LEDGKSVTKLPITLDREPLVDAVFEVRMAGDPHMADLLPGALFGQLEPRPLLQRLPTAEIPQPIRASDPNLQFSPLIRLDWGNFYISIGDRSLVISCKLPYPKWAGFKAAILDINEKVAQIGLSGSVERYSIKYVNIIPGATIAEQLSRINFNLRIGAIEASDDHVSVQMHHNEDSALHILSVVTGASGELADGTQVAGVVVDVDTIRFADFADFEGFSQSLEADIETLRLANKTKFFSCLTDEAINEMGPTYA